MMGQKLRCAGCNQYTPDRCVCGEQVKILSGEHKGAIAHCTYRDEDHVRVTPIAGDPLASIALPLDAIRPLTNEERAELKGVKGGNCNRACCQKPGAAYFNHSTLKYYCEVCAVLLNDANRFEAMRLWNHDLCTLETDR